MKLRLLALLIVAVGLPARAELVDLREAGKLEIFAPGDWRIGSEDMGDRFEVVIMPTREINAAARIVINLLPKDEYRSKGKLRDRLVEVTRRHLAASVEKKTIPQELFRRNGFGFFCNLTNAELVGRPIEKNNPKVMSLALVRLAPRVYAAVTIIADDFYDSDYQQLLGAVEGMELLP